MVNGSTIIVFLLIESNLCVKLRGIDASVLVDYFGGSFGLNILRVVAAAAAILFVRRCRCRHF